MVDQRVPDVTQAAQLVHVGIARAQAHLSVGGECSDFVGRLHGWRKFALREHRSLSLLTTYPYLVERSKRYATGLARQLPAVSQSLRHTP